MNVRKNHLSASFVAGHTDIGFSLKKREKLKIDSYIDIANIEELNNITKSEEALCVGGSVSLSMLSTALNSEASRLNDIEAQNFEVIVEALSYLGSVQIRNMSTIGGHLAVGPAISDIIPVLAACGSTVTFITESLSESEIKLSEFYTNDYGNKLDDRGLIKNITIPKSYKNEYISSFHQTHGRRDVQSTVNAAMKIQFQDSSELVNDVKLFFNGLGGGIVVRNAKETEMFIKNKPWNTITFEAACTKLVQEMQPEDQCDRKDFRKALVVGYFMKFFQQTTNHASISKEIMSNYSHGTQIFEDVPETQPADDPVWRPLPHLSANKHVTGTAQYLDDIPTAEGELFLAFVKSTEAHAEIVSIDTEVAKEMPGVHGFISVEDIKNNQLQLFPVIADKTVSSVGHLILGVLAESRQQAREAAKQVKVSYNPLKPILTLKEAIEAGSYWNDATTNIKLGDIKKGFAASTYIVEGEVTSGGQLHFYMETHRCLATPRDRDELDVTASLQNPTEAQELISKALGIPLNKVTVRNKRIGGSYGGKDVQGVDLAILASAGAIKFKRPIRYVLSRDEDKPITGGRHAAMMKYKVGFDANGKLESLKADIFLNGGFTEDVTNFVLLLLMTNFNLLYHCPNVELVGWPCKTNLPSSTSVRGFGVPQAVFLFENIMDHVARHLKKDPEKVREINLHKEGNILPSGQKLKHFNSQKVWDLCLKDAFFEDMKKHVKSFNKENKWRKRGYAVTVENATVGMPVHTFNQATALVHIYKDGTVLLAHGGTEMGQGLYTKTVQIASRALEIPIERVHIAETGTSVSANGPKTVSSATCDITGPAVQQACEILKDRLAPFRKAKPNASWDEWVMEAYVNFVNLSVLGYHGWKYKNPLDFRTMKGDVAPYFTHGAACSLVEIDCLTGQHKVLRTDIVMDIGKSLNPAIDIGQIEGAFVMGYGYMTNEEVIYDNKGNLETRGPLTYRIPQCTDIPAQFNVRLLTDSPNPKAVIYSSKGVSEPPLLLAISIFYAIKSAIAAARADNGDDGAFRLDSPATPDRIRLACLDNLLKTATQTET